MRVAAVALGEEQEGSRANYRIDRCIDLANNAPTEKPEATYHLVTRDGKTVLFERSSDGSGTVIDNHWTASDGEHYFVSIGMADVGQEYVLPNEGRGPGQRLVYVALQKTKAADSTLRPASAPGVRCDLVPG